MKRRSFHKSVIRFSLIQHWGVVSRGFRDLGVRRAAFFVVLMSVNFVLRLRTQPTILLIDLTMSSKNGKSLPTNKDGEKQEEPDAAAGGSSAAAGSGDQLQTSQRRLHSAQSSGMESSIFRFKNLNFVVPAKKKNEEDQHILRDVSGTVKWGRE